MFNTMEEIYENEFLRALVRDCKRFDMPGVFIEHNLGIQSKESGIYFVTGIDREAVRKIPYDKNFNPVNMLIKQKINSRKYHPVKVFKITDENPSVVSYEVQNYCCHSEFVDNIFPLFSIKNIDKIPNYTVNYLSRLYRKTHDNKYNDFMRHQYKTMFRQRMLNLQKVQNKKGFAGRYRDYEFSNIFNDEENIVMNFIKYFFRSRQKTSLRFIQREYGNINSLLIEKRYFKKYKKELKKYPDIIYSIDKRKTYKEFSFDSVREDTYGNSKINQSKKLKKCPCYRMSFPAAAMPIILGIYNNIHYAQHAPITAEEIVNSGKEWDAMVIAQQDMLYFEKNFCEQNIIYAIDNGYANHADYTGVPILFFKGDKEIVDRICREAIHSGSTYHTVENNKSVVDAGLSKLYYGYDLPKKPSELKKEVERDQQKNIDLQYNNKYEYIR